MTRPPLTALYVPGDRPDRFDKAVISGADVVIVDLEDAVAPAAKSAAREAVGSWLTGRPATAVQVRINGAGTPYHDDDLRAVEGTHRSVGVRIPKADSVQRLAALAVRLPDRPLHVLVESAAGVEVLAELARSTGVASVGLGEADLASELGLVDDEPLAWIRTRLVVAARAAGLPPPMMSVWTDLLDLDGLRTSCAAGRRRGFLGRAAIHPRQLAVIVEAFTPTSSEVDAARAVLTALDAAERRGDGVAVLGGGRMVDAAMRSAAERTVALAADQRPSRW